MGLREQLAADPEPFGAVVAVASCRDSLWFADLCWPPYEWEAELQRVIENRDPGVIFETKTRVVVFEDHGGELRFYAGGWGEDVYDHPHELGVFRSAGDAIRYAEAFLVRRLHPEQIAVPRGVLSVEYEWGRAEPGAANGRGEARRSRGST
jgi:hypothetical protein